MVKETLLSKFKPSIGEPNATSQIYEELGISVRTLDTYIDNILPSITDDALVTDDFIKCHINILKSMGGQLRHENAEYVKKFKEGQQTPPPPAENEELKSLKESIEELKNQLSGQQRQKAIEQLRQGVKDKAKTLKVVNQALFEDVANSIEVGEGMDVAALETAVKSAYEAKLKSYFGEGAEPYGGSNNAGGSSDDAACQQRLQAFLEQQRALGKLPPKAE